eukprot:gene1914-2172_t
MKHLVWDKVMKDKLLACLTPLDDENRETMAAIMIDMETQLVKLSKATQEEFKLNLQVLFQLEFGNHPPFKAFVNEAKVISLLYTNQMLYEKAGTVAMTAFDIAMSMGGSEAIVESFYSVMDTQRQVRQNHSTLEDRSILDWATSNILCHDNIIAKAARIYVDGMPSLKLPRHRVGVLKKKTESSYRASKVLTRMNSEKGRYPFLS